MATIEHKIIKITNWEPTNTIGEQEKALIQMLNEGWEVVVTYWVVDNDANGHQNFILKKKSI